MKKEVKYSDLTDRQKKIEKNEGEGLRMLHDEFDNPDWKHGDPIKGTITFTDEMDLPQPSPEPVRNLAAEIDDLAKRLKLVEDKVKEMN